MSEVISFRLNKDNLREAQALEILEAWCSNGYSVRQTIMEALLKLDDPGLESSMNDPLETLKSELHQVREILEKIADGGNSISVVELEVPDRTALTDGFISSVVQAVRPGMKVSS